MKKKIYPAIIAAILCLCAFTLAMTNWNVKSNGATIEFSGGKINSSFKGLKAEIVFDKEHPENGKMSASIETPSVTTGFFLKNDHVKDALGVDKYRTIKFVSISISKNAGGYSAKGNLTMKGVTRPGIIHFTFDDKGGQGVFRGNLKVIPKDFGIDHAGTPPEVMVKLTVPVTKS